MCIRDSDTLPGVAADELATVRALVTRELEQLGRFTEAADTARRALTAIDPTNADTAPQLAEAHLRFTAALLNSGDLEGADKAIDTALGQLDKFNRAQDSAAARLLLARSAIRLRQRNLPAALEELEKADERATTGPDNPDLSFEILIAMARTRAAAGESDRAITLAREVLATAKRRGKDWTAPAVAALAIPDGVGSAKPRTLCKYVDDLCSLFTPPTSGDKKLFAKALLATALSTSRLGLSARAAAISREAVAILSLAAGDASPDLLSALVEQSDYEADAGNAPLAAAALSRAVTIAEGIAAASPGIVIPNIDRVSMYDSLVAKCEAIGDSAGAMAASLRAANLSAARDGDGVDAIIRLREYAKLLTRLNKFPEALTAFDRCIFVASRVARTNPLAAQLLGDALIHSSSALLQQGRWFEALMAVTAGEPLTREISRSSPIFGYSLNVKIALTLIGAGDVAAGEKMLLAAVNGILEAVPADDPWAQALIETVVMHFESTGRPELASPYRWKLRR